MGSSGHPERLGKYTLCRRLAIGGMAEIFLARVRGPAGFERFAVVKQVLPQYAADAQFIRMLLQEARITATLHHSNVVQVLELDREGDAYFFAMEYVDGVDARRLWQAANARGEAIPLEHALRIVSSAAAGLHYAHEKLDADGLPLGLVHRDVSPSNVLVGFDGCVKISDFGIAKATLQASETNQTTVKGKLAYMSPEQCRGQPLDRRSDVFSLGVVLFELTTGSRLFEGESDFLVYSQILERELPRPSERSPGYPAALERIVLRALSRDPDGRFATARELEEALDQFARSSGLVPSQLALARYVEELLGAERIALDRGEPAGAGTGTLGLERSEAGTPAVEAATTQVQAARGRSRARRHRALLAGGVLALAAATAAAGYWHSTAGAADPGATAPATTAPATTVSEPPPAPAPEVATSPAREPAAAPAAQTAPTPPREQKHVAPPRPIIRHRPPASKRHAPRAGQHWNPDSPFAPEPR